MRTSPAGGDQLVSDPPGKRQVRKAIPVDVAQLAAAQAELQTPKTVRGGAYPRPALDLGGDPLAGGSGDHPAASALRRPRCANTASAPARPAAAAKARATWKGSPAIRLRPDSTMA